jgi:hypothetical protein
MIQIPEQVIVSSAPKAPKPAPAAPGCYTQRLERFNGGYVRVCDPVERTPKTRTASDLAALTR